MQDFAVLKLLDLFESAFRRMGVDYRLMRRIVQVKLALDGRRVATLQMSDATAPEMEDNRFFRSLWVYMLASIVKAVLLLMDWPLFLVMTIYISLLMPALMMIMAADFSVVLLDLRDRMILLPRPVEARTINAARVVHILIYLSVLTGALNMAGLVVGAYRFGVLFIPLMLASLFLLCLLVVALASLLYTAALKYFDGEKLKDMINALQVIIMVGMNIGLVLFLRTFRLFDLELAVSWQWWMYLLPPFWFAALISLGMGEAVSASMVRLAAMAMIIPPFVMFFYVKVISPVFEQNMAKFASVERVLHHRESIFTALLRKVSRLLPGSRVIGALVRGSHALLTKERALKLQLYPSIFGTLLLMPLVLVGSHWEEGTSFVEFIARLRAGHGYYSLYMIIVSAAIMIPLIWFSENHKAAWLYRAMPLPEPTPIVRGAVLGYIVSLVLPISVISYAVMLLLFGFERALDLFVIVMGGPLMVLIIVRLTNKRLPFSEEVVRIQAKSGVGGILTLVIAGGLALAHWLFAAHVSLYAYLVLQVLGILYLWQTSFPLTWQALDDDSV
ncbi:MAG: hypothetical protein DDT34_00927 [Firmicutes bacterium]|nr:hypothetical protein [Bacillota bacterium]